MFLRLIKQKFWVTVLLLAYFASGCATFEHSKFNKPQNQVNFHKLQMGDIIITPADFTNPISWFGHAGIMVSKNNIGEYPMFTSGYVETDVKSWLKSKKQYIVLRYKHFSPSFKKQLIENISTTRDKSYGITHKQDNEQFYCSQYIWYLFWKSAQDLGYQLDIANNINDFILPYDFLDSAQLTKIYLD